MLRSDGTEGSQMAHDPKFLQTMLTEAAPQELDVDGIFWIARTGVAWRDLHEHFGKWSSVYRQFRR